MIFYTHRAPALLSKPIRRRISVPLTLVAGEVFFERRRATAVRFHRVVHFFHSCNFVGLGWRGFLLLSIKASSAKFLMVFHGTAFDPRFVAFAVLFQ